MAVTTYEDRKLAGICTRCGKQPALDDNQLCAPCRDDQRERVARSMAKLAEQRKRERKCLDCGVQLKSRGLRRCPACRIRRGRVSRIAAGLNRDMNRDRDRIASRTSAVTEADGRTRLRYRGKHRGPATKAEADAQDLRDIAAAVQRCTEGLAYARCPEVAELPTIQRRDALEAALSHADHARRFLVELLERHGYDSGDSGDSEDMAED